MGVPILAAAAAAKTTTLPDVSIGGLFIHTVVALVVIVGGIWGVQKIWTRNKARGARPVRGQKPAPGLQILSRHSLGKDQHLAVVRWGEREVLVGISGQTITFFEDGERPTVAVEHEALEPSPVHRAVRSAFEATRQTAIPPTDAPQLGTVLERLRDLTARS